jgi:adenylate cyclase
MSESQSRRLAAILAADIAGYSALMGADEARTVRDLKGHQTVVLPMVGEFGGRIIDTAGDGILAEFPSVVNAVNCAIAIQSKMGERNAEIEPERRMQFRMGVNIGDVICDEARIYGDGINVAARLESIAEPGGICISGKVYDEISERLDLTYQNMGEQQLKNIARPLRVYRVAVRASPRKESPALALPDRPSIAVLPFQNMSGDPDQEYFADGMVEDITTGLSRIKWLFVIARNSSFTYKGKAVDIRLVGRELGVRYILEGSVRKASNRLRITTQLVEAATANHLWAEKFDGELTDVFDLQDQITAGVVGAIEPSVRRAEIERARRKPPENFDAYDLYLQALPLIWAHNPQDRAKGLDFLNAALRIDQSYAAAHGLSAGAYQQRFQRGGAVNSNDRETALYHARTALSLDTDDTTALSLAGFAVAALEHDLQAGLSAIQKALLHNPNSAQALGYSAVVNSLLGRFVIALDHARQSIRLSPFDAVRYAPELAMCTAFFCTGKYVEAVEAGQRALQYNSRFVPARALLAACFVRLNKLEDTRFEVNRVLAMEPLFRSSVSLIQVAASTPEVSHPILAALNDAGFPE